MDGWYDVTWRDDVTPRCQWTVDAYVITHSPQTRCTPAILADRNPYTDPERHNSLRHRRTDRQTDDSVMTIADHTACHTVQSVKSCLALPRGSKNAYWTFCLQAHYWQMCSSLAVVRSVAVIMTCGSSVTACTSREDVPMWAVADLKPIWTKNVQNFDKICTKLNHFCV